MQIQYNLMQVMNDFQSLYKTRKPLKNSGFLCCFLVSFVFLLSNKIILQSYRT